MIRSILIYFGGFSFYFCLFSLKVHLFVLHIPRNNGGQIAAIL